MYPEKLSEIIWLILASLLRRKDDSFMIYRIDQIDECNINPVTRNNYDNSWIIFKLTDSKNYCQFVGHHDGCAYTIKTSRVQHSDWKMAAGDFIDFNYRHGKNIILVMSENELLQVQAYYAGHSCNEPFLRENEPTVLIHSTPMRHWVKIQSDGMLKSWNVLHAENSITEDRPIGSLLGDPADFCDYIMFGGGVTGEVVVRAKETGKITMDLNSPYMSGARMYFDAKKMAEDGLLERDGCHIKVKDRLSLFPYLIWTATWDKLGISEPKSTPKEFSEAADNKFLQIFGSKGYLL